MYVHLFHFFFWYGTTTLTVCETICNNAPNKVLAVILLLGHYCENPMQANKKPSLCGYLNAGTPNCFFYFFLQENTHINSFAINTFLYTYPMSEKEVMDYKRQRTGEVSYFFF